MEMQCRTCDPPRLSPIHMVRRADGQQLVMGGSRIRATWSAEAGRMRFKLARRLRVPPALPSHRLTAGDVTSRGSLPILPKQRA